jgi:hypothetical protein
MMNEYWPFETANYWNEVAVLAAAEPPSESFKTDKVAKKVPLFARRPTAFDIVYLDEVSQYINSLGNLTAARVARALVERRIGHTEETYQDTIFSPTPRLQDVSVWNIKSFHHWMTLKEMAHLTSFDKFSRIVEIGAGIGESARMLLDAFGYKGEYVIVDLPSIIPYSKKNLEGYNIKFTTDYKSLEQQPETLVFSTWGLSEIELSLREQMLDHINPDQMFVAFQGKIFDVDNREYFLKDYTRRYKKYISLKQIPLHHVDGGNYYMWAY